MVARGAVLLTPVGGGHRRRGFLGHSALGPAADFRSQPAKRRRARVAAGFAPYVGARSTLVQAPQGLDACRGVGVKADAGAVLTLGGRRIAQLLITFAGG